MLTARQLTDLDAWITRTPAPDSHRCARCNERVAPEALTEASAELVSDSPRLVEGDLLCGECVELLSEDLPGSNGDSNEDADALLAADPTLSEVCDARRDAAVEHMIATAYGEEPALPWQHAWTRSDALTSPRRTGRERLVPTPAAAQSAAEVCA